MIVLINLINMLLEYKVVKCMNLMVTVLSISKFGIVSSYDIKYAILIAGIEPNQARN